MTVPQDTLAPIGRCSVRPLVQQIDGNNNVFGRGEIVNVPYLRAQGGKNAVVIDPVVGDIGLCGFCERDISMVKRSGKSAAPNTRRQYSLNDAVYMFTMISGTPEQYIHFKSSGIDIKSTGDININGLIIKSDGTLIYANGVVSDTHSHSQANDSAGNTEQDVGVPKNG